MECLHSVPSVSTRVFNSKGGREEEGSWYSGAGAHITCWEKKGRRKRKGRSNFPVFTRYSAHL